MLIKALAAAAGNFGGEYTIDNSLRFNDNDSANLSRTPSVAGNRKTWTWSGWVKRGNLGDNYLFTTTDANINEAMFLFFGADNLRYWDSKQGSQGVVLQSNAVFRDVSGWYHIVLMVDREAATPADRAKLYVNGEELSYSATSYPNQNENSFVNATETHYISADPNYFDGYMAEINFIDGQALTPDDFGEINEDTGEWSPIEYAGTYGTNGFYLPFDGNANDSSGNGNNWTENNLASTDYMIDTPSTNFSVLNPLDNGGSTISNGNLEHTSTNTSWKSTRGTIAVNSGKWYWEGVFTAGGTASADGIGFALGSASLTSFSGDTHSYGYIQNGVTLADGGGSVAYGDSYTTNDIIGIALDLDAGTCTFYKNNVSQGQAFSGLSGTFFPFSDTYDNSKWNLNFGADSSFAGNKTRQGNTDANGIGDFYYTPSAGYLALCSDNLPAPAIEQPETQFNVVTYTGTGGTQAITGVGFQPDFVWIKGRSVAYNHLVFDSVRGVQKALHTNLTNATSTYTNALSSFDADGFTYGADCTGNQSGASYVAWCLKAGGTAVTNTDGTITSQVSANVDAGFSIVGYTGTGSNASVGHGLSVTPDLVIVKNRDFVDNWRVWHTDLSGGTYYLNLNATSAQASNSSFFTGLPTTSVFNIGTDNSLNRSGDDHIAYCFHSVEGFSKFGSYVGNGSSTDGPFVYTGFKNAFVLVKRTNSTSNWVIIDNERIGYNIDNKLLYPNLSNAESTGGVTMDLLSNGFKPRFSGADYNASGGTYIYMAFAEHPFNYATGR